MSSAANPSSPEYDTLIERGIRIEMSDGIRLAAEVSYPAVEGRRARGLFPVIVTQTPYVADRVDARVRQRFLVSHGYICAMVHVRGTVDSEGEFSFLSSRDERDSVEIIDWASTLPGADGTVGLNGFSYGGLTQLFAAAAVGPSSALRAIRPAAIGNFYRGTFFVGGLPSTIFHSYFPALGDLMGTKSAANAGRAIYDDVLRDGESKLYREFWRERSADELVPRIVANGIPVLLWSGWEDCYPSSVIDLWARFQNAAAGRPIERPLQAGSGRDPRYQLIVGHGFAIHDQERSDTASAEVTLRWFDTHLKGRHTGFGDADGALHLAEHGSRVWFDFAEYPLRSRPLELHLDDRPDPEWRWSTQPTDRPLLIAGPSILSLRVMIEGDDAGIAAELFDLDEQGARTRISVGAMLASVGALDEERTWRDAEGRVIRPFHRLDEPKYPASGAAALEIALAPTLWRIERGHSLELAVRTVGTADVVDPRWTPVPARPTDQQVTALRAATVSLDLRHPSVLRVPVLSPDDMVPSPRRWESDGDA